MSAVLGVFPRGGAAPDDAAIHGMLAAMRQRGGERTQLLRAPGAVLGVARNEWELAAGFSGNVLVVKEGEITLAADASLFYREDLVRALRDRGEPPAGDTPSHLIVAAYRAWGTECVRHLEGDFSFILWDGARKLVFGARDIAGTRPLHYGTAGQSFVVASKPGAIVAHPDSSGDLNPVALAEAASGLFAASRETCYRDVSWLPAGSTLQHDARGTRIERYWEPRSGRSSTPFREAAAELRELLCRAAAERMSPAGPTALWLSGGYDSTAVLGAAEAALERRGGGHLETVSVSYPPGDPGHEDELIRAATGRWGSPMHWIDVESIPLLENAEERAGDRDEPFAHGFEMFNRALAERSRSVGARVAFTGAGGDPLFAVSPVYLADLLRSGRWMSLAREWAARRPRSARWRAFFEHAIQPSLPDAALDIAARLRGGRPLRRYLDRPVADWIEPGFARRHELSERERRFTPRRGRRSHADYEVYWYFLYPFTSRIYSVAGELALESGVELRTPLFDRRVVEFALSRPREERASGRETKRLLREAMKGLLPDTVLEPRKARTGLSSGYFRRSLRGPYAGLLKETFLAPRLADLGIIHAERLRKSCERFVQHGGSGATEVHLFFTLQTELWLRSRESARVPSDTNAREEVAGLSA